MMTLTITLPHTPRELSPNAKVPLTQRGAVVAGYKKTAAKRRARTMAGAVTLEALGGHKMQPTHYRVIWFYKGNKPDADNCLARCKAYLDGACKALGIDDRTMRRTGTNPTRRVALWRGTFGKRPCCTRCRIRGMERWRYYEARA